MTGLHDKRSAKESRSVKGPAQPKPERAPPAKRVKRDAAAAAPRGREARAVKPKSEGAPPARRAKRDAAPAAPLEREAHAVKPVRSTPTLTVETAHLIRAYTLRTRKVFVPNTSKPGPLQYKKGEEPVYDASWQTPACAKAALEHYNRLNEDEHELVKAVDSVAFFFNGLWMHANFLAKLKGATSCVDLVPKHFFAELRAGPKEEGMSCVSCIVMDPADPETAPVRGCRICPSRIFHPAAGGHRGSPHPTARVNRGATVSIAKEKPIVC